MKFFRILFPLIFIGHLGLLLWLGYKEPIDRKPIWEPFEFNPNINLESLVEEGFRFSHMPCGMVHFAKTIGDTTMSYYIDYECIEIEEMLIIENLDELEEDYSYGIVEWIGENEKHKREENPFYPFDWSKVKTL